MYSGPLFYILWGYIYTSPHPLKSLPFPKSAGEAESIKVVFFGSGLGPEPKNALSILFI